MKRFRPERQVSPITLNDLQHLHDRGIHQNLWRHLLTQHNVDESATAEVVLDALNQATLPEDLDAQSKHLLAHIHACGGRQRGELLRKEFLLQTLEDMTPQLAQLLQRGIVWPIPSSDQDHMTLGLLIEQHELLQVDLALPDGYTKTIAQWSLEPLTSTVAEEIEGTLYEQTSLDMLELNLLHLCDALHAETLKLNKSGAPNKRSLSRFSTGLVLPGETQPTETLDAQNLHHLDYVALLLALAKTLGFLHVQTEGINTAQEPTQYKSVTTDFDAMQSFFGQNVSRRNKILEQALQNLKAWDEVLSHTLPISPQQEQDIDAQLSLTRTNGQWLIGARGYIMSILRRAPLEGWMDEEALIDLCIQFDRDYVDSVLASRTELNARNYVHIFITHMLAWAGIIEQGKTPEGQRLVRLTSRGASLIQGEELPSAPQSPCLIVQPNFEVMVFLDNTTTQTLFKLYQLGTRVGLADRVATFRMTSQSIQRGYSLGLDARGVIKLLNDLGHTPLDQTVDFQLTDWERIWKQVTLYADGILLRHEDPDTFDLIVGQLQHEWRNNDDLQLIRLSPGAAFVSQADLEPLGRMMTHNPSLLIDYLGVIPPCFEFVDTLAFVVNPTECDIITWNQIDTIATKVQAQSKRLRWYYELDLDAIETRWPEDTLKHLLDFLRPRSIGGLPAEQEIKLRALLSRRRKVHIEQQWVVVRFGDALTAQLFANIPEVQDMGATALGDRAFGIPNEHLESLQVLLDRLSIATS